MKKELTYRNNSDSLFKKYAKLVTVFANTIEGRYYLSQFKFFKPQNKVSLFLPNGWHEQIGDNLYLLTVFTKPFFARSLYSTLEKIDIAFRSYPMLTGKDMLDMMFIDLGLKSYSSKYPQVLLGVKPFNPNASPESTSVDGQVGYNNGSGEAWATIRGQATGTTATDTSEGSTFIYVHAHTTTNLWDFFIRSMYLFDTSSLSDAVTKKSAIFRKYVTSLTNNFTDSVSLVASTPAANTAVTTADFDQFGTTKLATDRTLSGLTTTAYNDWTLNASGLTAVELAGVTKLGLRSTADNDNVTPTWVSGNATVVNTTSSGGGWAGGANPPVLLVTYFLPNKANNLLQMFR